MFFQKQSNKHSTNHINLHPDKILVLNMKELILSSSYKYDFFLIKQRTNNTYYDKIIK
jgi:hypothetical protein